MIAAVCRRSEAVLHTVYCRVQQIWFFQKDTGMCHSADSTSAKSLGFGHDIASKMKVYEQSVAL